MNSESENVERKDFLTEIKDRLRSPWCPLFLGYLLLVFVIGGLGVLLSIFDTIVHFGNAPEIIKNIGVFFIAIFISSIVDLNLAESTINKKAFLVWSTLLGFVSVTLLVLVYFIPTGWSYVCAGLGVLISLFAWILANSDSDKFEESIYINLSGKNKGHGEDWK